MAFFYSGFCIKIQEKIYDKNNKNLEWLTLTCIDDLENEEERAASFEVINDYDNERDFYPEKVNLSNIHKIQMQEVQISANAFKGKASNSISLVNKGKRRTIEELEKLTEMVKEQEKTEKEEKEKGEKGKNDPDEYKME